ncbi:hypothetical protein [Thomasclavelia cocleata]|jgi:hypothetical protein|nr:hypothetical protein [Thomasclavelia cocleata]
MFKLKYRIFEEKSDMQGNDLDLLEEQSSIYGFISLKFNEEEIGYIIEEDEAPSPEDINCEMYLYHDNLTWWFETLLEVLNLLERNMYVRFQVLESADRWVSFEKNGSNLIVIFFNYFDLGGNIVSLDKITSNSKIDECIEIIDFNNFQKELITSTYKFIQEVADINQKLLNTNRFHNLCQKLMNFKEFKLEIC